MATKSLNSHILHTDFASFNNKAKQALEETIFDPHQDFTCIFSLLKKKLLQQYQHIVVDDDVYRVNLRLLALVFKNQSFLM